MMDILQAERLHPYKTARMFWSLEGSNLHHSACMPNSVSGSDKVVPFAWCELRIRRRLCLEIGVLARPCLLHQEILFSWL